MINGYFVNNRRRNRITKINAIHSLDRSPPDSLLTDTSMHGQMSMLSTQFVGFFDLKFSVRLRWCYAIKS